MTLLMQPSCQAAACGFAAARCKAVSGTPRWDAVGPPVDPSRRGHYNRKWINGEGLKLFVRPTGGSGVRWTVTAVLLSLPWASARAGGGDPGQTHWSFRKPARPAV